MKVSHNELTGTCRRALDALGLPPGDAEDAAEMAVWLEDHGLGGIAALGAALERLRVAPPPLARPFEDTAVAVVDVAGASMLQGADLAVDLAYVKARAQGLAVIRVRGCRDRKLVLGPLVRCARRGADLLARWRSDDATGAVDHVAAIGARAAYPTLRRYRADAGSDGQVDRGSMTIIAARDLPLVAVAGQEPPGGRLLETITAEQFAARARRAMTGGLEIDDAIWSRLKDIAAETLVEPSETSRQRGAGEGAG